MNNHVWLASVDNDLQLNFSMVSYPAMSILEVGHMRDGDSQVAFVTKASYDRNLVIQDDIPNELSLKLTVGKDKNVQVFAKLLHYKTYIFENGAYRLIEGIADYTVNGKKFRVILEVGFNADKSRFFNGKKVKKIKE